MSRMHDDIYVCFHVGRGGMFNDAGHMEYLPNVTNFKQLLDYCDIDLVWVTDDEDGNMLPDDEWYICDDGGKHLVEGREAIESPTGELNFDGDYDRYYVKSLDDCSEVEAKSIVELYENRPYLFDDRRVMDAACDLLDLKYVDGAGCSIQSYPSNMLIFYNGANSLHLNRDQFVDEEGNALDERSARDELKEMGFLNRSIERILNRMRIHEWVQ